MRQLKEIAREILEKKFANDPRKMATALELDLMYVRRATGLAALDGTTQQKTFEFTLKLLPLCKELGIDPAQDLIRHPSEGELLNVASRKSRDGSPSRSDAGSGSGSSKTSGAGSISKGKNKKSRTVGK